MPEETVKPPVFKKSEPIPVLAHWSVDVWVIVFAAWPMALQGLYYWATGTGMPAFGTFVLYWFAFQANAIHEVKVLARLGQKYGYLDGDQHARDDVPDVGVSKAVMALLLTTSVRPLFTLLLTYNRSELPLPSVWLPVELFLYSIVLDFFFYCYHRACHEVDWLWQYHRTHHLTKHPNPFLSAYADHEQEFLEIAVIPIATWCVLRACGFPMGFYDWWICHEFIVFAEAMGHSGIRLHVTAPGLSRHLLSAFNCELLGEDHDIHHRKGYRKSYNYGKQTRLWDVIFGTTGPRYETIDGNIDHSKQVILPLL